MRFGVWGENLKPKPLQELIESAIALGATTFDHADIYGHYTTEAQFGEIIKANPSLRNQMQLITKCGINLVCKERPDYKVKSYDSSQAHIISSVERSLQNLETEFIDLLLIHRPDFLMDPLEIAEAATKLIKSGKIKAIGVSNFTPSQFDLLNSYIPLETNQVEISLTTLDTFKDGTLDQALKHKFRPQAWSPLSGGALFQNETPQSERINELAKTLIAKYGISLDQLIYAWLRKHPSNIQIVTGTSKISRIEAAVESCKVEISSQDWYALWEASEGQEVA